MNPPKQPQDVRARILFYVAQAKSLGSSRADNELADDILHLCEAAALAALPENKKDNGNLPLSPGIAWNQAIATAQANIHSVFGGAK